MSQVAQGRPLRRHARPGGQTRPVNTSAFVGTNPTDDSITSGLPAIQTRSVRPAWSLPRLCGFITADTAGRLLLLLVEYLQYVKSDISVATNIVVTHLRMSIGIRNAT